MLVLQGCAASLTPRLADPVAAPSGVSVKRIVTVIRGPQVFLHEHFIILRVVASSRRLSPSVDLAAMARASVDALVGDRVPGASVIHLPPSDVDARAVLASDCVSRRPKRLSASCELLFRNVASRHDADAVLVVDDWRERGAISMLPTSRPGTGVLSRRSEANNLTIVAFSHLGAQVVVSGQPKTFVGPPCHEDGSGIHALDNALDPGTLDLAQLDWLEQDLRRRVERSIERALARSGVVPFNPAACADPESEGTGFVPPLGLFGG